jgi:hypothetical protein
MTAQQFFKQRDVFGNVVTLWALDWCMLAHVPMIRKLHLGNFLRIYAT